MAGWLSRIRMQGKHRGAQTMRITMTQREFDGKLESDTAAMIFGFPFMLMCQSGAIDPGDACHLEFDRVGIVAPGGGK